MNAADLIEHRAWMLDAARSGARAEGRVVMPAADWMRCARELAGIACELVRCLEASTDALVLERDALCDAVTTDDGAYLDPDDERQVREYEELIAANRAALACARVNKEGAS